MSNIKKEIQKIMQEQSKHNPEIKEMQAQQSALKKKSNELAMELDQVNSDFRIKKQSGHGIPQIVIQEFNEKTETLQAEQQGIVKATNELDGRIKSLGIVLSKNERKLNNLRTLEIKEQSTLIIHAALKRSGLLKAIREVMELNKLNAPNHGEDYLLKGELIKAFFNAIELDGKPTYEDSLTAFNQLLETDTAQTSH